MAGYRQKYGDQRSDSSASGNLGSGVCMINNSWRDEQYPDFIHFISSFLRVNGYRLNFLPIAPDFIFNNGGLSVAFIFITNWNSQNIPAIFGRITRLNNQFGHFYVVATIPSAQQNESFINSYFKYGVEIGKPTFIIVDNPEMGFEKIVKLAYVKGECKKKDVISKLKAEVMEAYVNVITAIPGLDNHDANALISSIGSIEALSKASKEFIMVNTDLSAEKAELIEKFFKDSKVPIISREVHENGKQSLLVTEFLVWRAAEIKPSLGLHSYRCMLPTSLLNPQHVCAPFEPAPGGGAAAKHTQSEEPFHSIFLYGYDQTIQDLQTW